MKIELKSNSDVKRVILAAAPSYKKHNACVYVFGESGISINSFWDGGSKSYFAIIELATGRRIALPSSSHPFFDIAGRGMANMENPDVAADHVGNVRLKHLPEGFAIVETGVFMGKTATATVYLNPANMPAQLTAGGVL